jgi:hypothetical protein
VVELKEAFLSYSHEDRVIARRVKDILEANAVTAFLAHEDLDVSVQWRTEILRHLDTSSTLIAIVTENFIKSVWANQEVGMAIAKKLPIIPLMFSGSLVLKGFIEMYQGTSVSESKLDTVVKSVIPRINEGLSSADRTVLKDLKITLGRLLITWSTYTGLPSNEKWFGPAIEDIQESFGKERDELVSLISDGTGMASSVKSQAQVIVSQIQRFALYKFDIQALFTSSPFAEILPHFQELERRGNQVFETARALHSYLEQTQGAASLV